MSLELVYPNGDAVDLPDAQRAGVLRVAEEQGLTKTHKYLTVHKEIAGPAVLIQANGMWIGIEPDGHAHT